MKEIFAEILKNSFYSVFLIIAVLLIREVISKKTPKWLICMLWALVGIRLLVPFSIESRYNFLPEFQVAEESSALEYESEDEIISEDTSDRWENQIESSDNSAYADISENISDYVSKDGSENGFVAGVDSTDDWNNSHYFESEKTDSLDKPSDEENKESFFEKVGFSGLWLLGVVSMLSYGIISYARLKKRVSVFSLCENGVRKCEYISSPFVLGVFSPEIYIPFGFSKATEKYIIKHEKAHVERKDYLSKIIGFIALSVHWFNPFVWISFVLFCKDIEYACDEKVIREFDVSEKQKYSKALLECSVKGNVISASPVAFGEIGVKDRVTYIMSYKKAVSGIIAVFVLIYVFTAAAFLTVPAKDEASGEMSEESFDILESSESSIDNSEIIENSSKENSEFIESSIESEVSEPFSEDVSEFVESSIESEVSEPFSEDVSEFVESSIESETSEYFSEEISEIVESSEEASSDIRDVILRDGSGVYFNGFGYEEHTEEISVGSELKYKNYALYAECEINELYAYPLGGDDISDKLKLFSEKLTNGVIANSIDNKEENITMCGTERITVVTIDLGENAKDLEYVKICGVWDNFNRGFNSQKIFASVSDDNVNFEYADFSDYYIQEIDYEQTSEFSSGHFNFTYKFETLQNCRYVRIVMSSPQYVLSIGEIQIFGRTREGNDSLLEIKNLSKTR